MWAASLPASVMMKDCPMKTMRRLLASTFLAYLWSPSAALDLRAQDLTIANARIIVGTGAVTSQGSVVVRGGRIVSASQNSTNAAGNTQAARIIDAKGMTVMPGFIDA